LKGFARWKEAAMIKERVVLVTGATGGLGRVVARRVAASGARVAVTGRNRSSLESLADELGVKRERILAHSADLGDAVRVKELIDEIEARWEGVDALVNLAGGWTGGKPLAEVTEQEWDAAFGLNLRSAFLINRAVLPFMLRKGWGRIVNISSKAAESPGPKQAAYNAAKAGLIALTASIAAEYRRSGIAANVLLPSIIDTQQNRSQMPDADHSRWVKPEEIASLVLFLLSDEAGCVNGAAIPVYGKV
jgi:NAD(P)-dependent dehydrogenase (short-subunit alcohol dehydrogenase family)